MAFTNPYDDPKYIHDVIRDKDNYALLNKDVKSFEQYKYMRNQNRQIANIQKDLNDLIEKVNELDGEIKKLLNKE